MSGRRIASLGKGNLFVVRRWSSELCTAAWRTRCTRPGREEGLSVTGRNCRFHSRKVGRPSLSFSVRLLRCTCILLFGDVNRFNVEKAGGAEQPHFRVSARQVQGREGEGLALCPQRLRGA